MAGKYSILNVSQRETIHGRVVLIGAAQKGNVGVHISREVSHLRFPRLVAVGI